MIIRIMSYNIGHYNMGLSEGGFPPNIFDEKYTNLKEMLMEIAPDIVCLQEDAHYIDRAKTKKSPDSIFSPVWKHSNGYKLETIKAKYSAVSGSYQLINFSIGQSFRRGIFNVNNKKILVVSAHVIAHVGNSAKRKIQYTEMFDHIRKENWDYCVVAGDFNTTENVDKKNLKALCEANDFTMAIGQYLPWVNTFMGRTEGQTKHSFDNILVSKGLTIKSTKVLRDWYGKLYSDHVPVIADIVIP